MSIRDSNEYRQANFVGGSPDPYAAIIRLRRVPRVLPVEEGAKGLWRDGTRHPMADDTTGSARGVPL
ncbi:MAG: hypothetical protein ACE144_11445 [Thermodesulfobacteriota bacterium]